MKTIDDLLEYITIIFKETKHNDDAVWITIYKSGGTTDKIGKVKGSKNSKFFIPKSIHESGINYVDLLFKFENNETVHSLTFVHVDSYFIIKEDCSISFVNRIQ